MRAHVLLCFWVCLGKSRHILLHKYVNRIMITNWNRLYHVIRGKSDHVTYFQNKSKWGHSMDLKRRLGMMVGCRKLIFSNLWPMHSSIREFFFRYPRLEPAWITPAPQCRAAWVFSSRRVKLYRCKSQGDRIDKMGIWIHTICFPRRVGRSFIIY
jgi:hypothetical protein